MDGLEPHGTIYSAVQHALHADGVPGGGGVPGVWDDWVGGWVGYTGVLPGTLPGPIFSTNLASGPYPRPYEGNSPGFDEVSQI